MPHELAAVLFDMDGTLLDSEKHWERAEQATMAYFGSSWTAADQRNSVGGPLERVVAVMAQRVDEDPSWVMRVLVTEIEHLVATVPAAWMPGAQELVAEVAQALPWAIVSNSWRVIVDLLVARAGLQPTVTVTSTEASSPKPDPAPYLAACRQLQVDPASALVIEDSPTGVAAGLAAGCWVLSISDVTASLPQHDRLLHRDSLDGVSLQQLRQLVKAGHTC